MVEESKKAFSNDEDIDFNDVHTNIFKRDHPAQDIEIEYLDQTVTENDKTSQNDINSSLNFYNKPTISNLSSHSKSQTKITSSAVNEKAKINHFNKIVAKVIDINIRP